jgi:paraquat-inducible protein B
MPDSDRPLPPVPESKGIPRSHTRLSLVWIIPILAALVGAWIAVTRVLNEGPKITITFHSAEGLEAGKTKVRYNGVDIGTVTAIRLADDHQKVIVTAQMAPKTEGFLADDTKFWVVRPRISGANVTGLGTLISGAYIGLEIGTSKIHKRDFVALETQPVVTGEAPGRLFVLKTADLGSIDDGTPVFFRRLQVGQVASYALDPDGKLITVKIFVRAPYDQYVNPNTRFWHASGVDLSLSASGLKVQTQSVLSILIGGVAFETDSNSPVLPPADANTVFTLFGNRTEAFEPTARSPQIFELVFNQSVRGLSRGAPVEFRGIPVGEVTDIRAQIDLKTFQFSVPVTISLDAQRLGVKFIGIRSHTDLAAVRRKVIDSLVAHGVRAQLKTGNLLTGAVYVALDFFPGSPPATVDWSQHPARLPTIPGQLEAIEARITNIVDKLDQMPLKQIGENLQKALADLDLTLVSARGTLATAQGTFGNTSKLTEQNSAQIQQFESTLQEVSRAARSVRVLTDYLERHPEALLRGKKGEAK